MMREVARSTCIVLGLALLHFAAAAKLNIYEAAANAALDQPPVQGVHPGEEGPGKAGTAKNTSGTLQKPAAAEVDKTNARDVKEENSVVAKANGPEGSKEVEEREEIKKQPPGPPTVTNELSQDASAAKVATAGSKNEAEHAKASVKDTATASTAQEQEGSPEASNARNNNKDAEAEEATAGECTESTKASMPEQNRSQPVNTQRLQAGSATEEETNAAVEPEDDSDAPAHGVFEDLPDGASLAEFGSSGETSVESEAGANVGDEADLDTDLEKDLPEGASFAEFGSSGEASVESDAVARTGAEADLDALEDAGEDTTEKPSEEVTEEDTKEDSTATATTTAKSGSWSVSVAWLYSAAVAFAMTLSD